MGEAEHTQSLHAYTAKNAEMGWTGRALGFDDGQLELDAKGNAKLSFKDDDMGHEEADGGRLIRTVRMANSEVLALRDYLSSAFPASPNPLLESLNWAMSQIPEPGEGDARTLAIEECAERLTTLKMLYQSNGHATGATSALALEHAIGALRLLSPSPPHTEEHATAYAKAKAVLAAAWVA